MADLPAIPGPYDEPTEFEVKRAELKRDLPAKDGKPAKAVIYLGLIGPQGKGYAEMFADQDPATWPSENTKLTLVLDPPKQEGWLPTAKKPRSGGGRGGRSPADTKRIERMHAQEMALRYLALFDKQNLNLDESWEDFAEKVLRPRIDWFVEDTGK